MKKILFVFICLVLFSTENRLLAQFSGGFQHSCIVCKDSTLQSIGYNKHGELGNGNTINQIDWQVINSPKIMAIQSGGNHNLILDTNGNVYTWGYNQFGQLGNASYSNSSNIVSTGLTGVYKIFAGENTSFAIHENGKVYGWGNNINKQISTDSNQKINSPILLPDLIGIKKIASGPTHTLAITNQGKVWAWGNNSGGQLGLFHNKPIATAQPIETLNGIVDIAVGMQSSLALTENGKVYSFGSSVNGSLGQMDAQNLYRPKQIQGLFDIIAIAMGQDHAMAIRKDGTLWVWGLNNYGQLGTGTAFNLSTPTYLEMDAPVKSIQCATYHSLVELEDGRLFGFGYNTNNQLADGSLTHQYSPVEIPLPCALKTPSEMPCESRAKFALEDSLYCGASPLLFSYIPSYSNHNAWYIDEQKISEALPINELILNEGTHTVKFVKNIDGCHSTFEKQVIMQKLPYYNQATNQNICINSDPLVLDNDTTNLWNGIGVEMNVFYPENVGFGTYTLHYQNQMGACLMQDSISIEVNQPTAIQIIGQTALCPGDSVNLSVEGFDFVSWNGIHYSHHYQGLALYETQLYLEAYDHQGCLSADSIALTFSPNPLAAFDFYSTEDQIQFDNLSLNMESCLWNFGDGQSSTEMNAQHQFQNPGHYPVQLIVFGGCSSDTIVQQLSIESTGMAEKSSNPIKLFPNPSSGLVYIKTNENFDKIIIRDMTGRNIKTHSMMPLGVKKNTPYRLDLNLANGLYFIEISDKTNTWTSPITIIGK